MPSITTNFMGVASDGDGVQSISIAFPKENRSRYMKITYLGNCKPSNHLNDASRMSFEQLNSLQLSEYVIFIWFDLFSLFINIWAIISCSGDTKLFNGISSKVPLLQYSIQLPWYQCLACLFWQCTFHQHWPSPLNLGCIHISPTLLWCLIAGIKCSGGFGKLVNNMGGPSPPPPL